MIRRSKSLWVCAASRPWPEQHDSLRLSGLQQKLHDHVWRDLGINSYAGRSGAPGETRTPGLLVRNHERSQNQLLSNRHNSCYRSPLFLIGMGVERYSLGSTRNGR
jgi:hypothetical protein